MSHCSESDLSSKTFIDLVFRRKMVVWLQWVKLFYLTAFALTEFSPDFVKNFLYWLTPSFNLIIMQAGWIYLLDNYILTLVLTLLLIIPKWLTLLWRRKLDILDNTNINRNVINLKNSFINQSLIWLHYHQTQP